MLPKPQAICSGCPLNDPPNGSTMGFSRPDGDGTSGVLMVAEALGASEVEEGIPLVGKAGHYWFNGLNRVGITRDHFTLFNVVACRPPDNKLVGMPWEKDAIEHCRPNLDAVIEHARRIALENNRTFTILTLGKTAFLRVMGLDAKKDAALLKLDYIGYPLWNETYKAFVVAADHPSFLMRGNHHLAPISHYATQRAVEIARDGLTLATPDYLLDPEPMQFKQWVDDYLKVAGGSYLSYDIETPMKQGKDEEAVSKEEDDDYRILRCSFSYRPNEAVSVPWTAQYLADLERLFGSSGKKVGWNNSRYDDPRIRAQVQINGDIIDGMLAWHVLNSSLPKGLGFVAPFYVKNTSMWKHLSEGEPAFYNAKDADMALQCWLGIHRDLQKGDLGKVFDRHVIEVDRVFHYMGEKGVKLDLEMRKDAEERLQTSLNGIEEGIAGVIPPEVLKLQVYKNDRTDTEGLVRTMGKVMIRACPRCNIKVKVDHYKSIGKKRLKAGEVENPCVGLKSIVKEIETELWARPIEFKLSNQSLQRYGKSQKHITILDPKRKVVTYDEKAISRLIKKYPTDPLYPRVVEFRKVQKLLSTYIGVTLPDGAIRGGMPTGPDGRVHTSFGHNPSTLRSASQNPNLQNLPRPAGPDDPASIIRNLIVAGEGRLFLARDFSGIEAVLVGYFAADPGYVRLSRRDVHSFYTAYALHELDGRVSANDLPLLSWDDDKLFTRLGEIKKEFKEDRNNLYKHLVHGCVTGDHEVLTLFGWKAFKDLQDEEEIAQWDNGVLRFVVPSQVVRAPFEGDLHKWSARGMSACMTSNHRVPIVNSYGTLKSSMVEDVTDGQMGWGRVPVHGTLERPDLKVPDSTLRLVVAIQADGHVVGNHVVFHLVKDRKKERLRALLDSRGLPYSEAPCKCHPGRGVRIAFNFKSTAVSKFLWGPTKSFILDDLMNLSVRQRHVFLDELPWWDGCRSNGISGKQTAYMNTNKHNVEVVQLLCHISGRQGVMTCSNPKDRKPIYSVSFNHRNYCNLSTVKATKVPHTGLVYCVTVPSGWFMIRHEGKVSITGNSNFFQGPKGAAEKILAETGIEYPVHLVKKVMDIYFELFPSIRKWHSQVMYQADKDGYLRNPFGYIHRFSKVFDWEKIGGKWQKSPGPQANEVVAFGPQSTAAAIIKEAMLRLYQNRFEEAGQFLRLLIHDELFLEVLEELVRIVDAIVKEEMERPIPELRMPASWGMGDCLSILTEEKVGKRWGMMK